jgi:hypothetical protein
MLCRVLRIKEQKQMKVEVTTVESVKFKRWQWFSNWIDIAVFDYESRPFLVQMRVSRTNAKSFRAVSVTGWSYKQATTQQIGDLTQMKERKASAEYAQSAI